LSDDILATIIRLQLERISIGVAEAGFSYCFEG
jgi:hypothetical protein